MSRIEDTLYEASFRGVSFLISTDASATTVGGRKTVTHEYVNSFNRVTEDLGQLPKTFTITGLIHGENYIEDKDALIAALETKGKGQLIHPFFGTVEVVSTTYTLNETPGRLGSAEFSMTFEQQKGQLPPSALGVTEADISNGKSDTKDALKCDILKKFDISGTSSFKTYTETKNKLIAIADAFDKQRKSIVNKVLTTTKSIRDEATKVRDQSIVCLDLVKAFPSTLLRKRDQAINKINARITSFRTDVDTLMREPSALANDLSEMFNEVQELAEDTADEFRLLRGFFNFGFEDGLIVIYSDDQQQRADNLDCLNRFMRVGSLASAYEAATQTEYSNEEELNDAQSILEEQFQAVINLDLTNSTRWNLIRLRQNAKKFFDTERLNVSRVVNVNVPQLPSSVISFMYYGDETRGEELALLNDVFSNNFDNAFMQGDIQVLSP